MMKVCKRLKDIKYLQIGNRKLPKTMAIFNLPAIKTCPGATVLCSKECYALKAEKIYPTVLPYRERCLVLAMSGVFKGVIYLELKLLISKNKIDTVRVHESGDFFSQQYWNDWVWIAQHCPDLTFFAYTKSWHINFSNAPKNFILFYSEDNTTKYWNKTIDNIAEMKDYSKPNGSEGGNAFLCWDNKIDKPNKCKKCSYCYSKSGVKKKVIFFKH